MPTNLKEKVDITLISWQRPKMTKLVIQTILRNTPRSAFRLIVVDNGSDDTLYLENAHSDGIIDELILNETNLGLEPARNQALMKVKGEFFVCADNDCLPQKDWLENLTSLMTLHPDYGAISLRTQVMIGTGNIFDGKEDEDIVEFPHPGGSFRIMRTEKVRLLGGWRDVPGRGTEERHICGKIREIGFKTGFAVQVKCLHLFGPKETDRWGYPKEWKPEETGHSDIWHPALEAGDIEEDLLLYAGEEDVVDYIKQ